MLVADAISRLAIRLARQPWAIDSIVLDRVRGLRRRRQRRRAVCGGFLVLGPLVPRGCGGAVAEQRRASRGVAWDQR
jgi:hypothetical protein